jgi:hypothetical protein
MRVTVSLAPQALGYGVCVMAIWDQFSVAVTMGLKRPTACRQSVKAFTLLQVQIQYSTRSRGPVTTSGILERYERSGPCIVLDYPCPCRLRRRLVQPRQMWLGRFHRANHGLNPECTRRRIIPNTTWSF